MKERKIGTTSLVGASLTLAVAMMVPVPGLAVDRCPDSRAGKSVGMNGCVPDCDRDGVPDHLDQCPATNYGVRVNSIGCDLDIDGDGVPYYRDRCQTTPPGAQVGRDGCMMKAVLDDVLFEFDRSDLRPDGKRFLDRLAPALQGRDDVARIRVTGHADSIGSIRYNQSLSEARAATVRRYLQAQGVTKPIATGGRGETKPVASNANPAGRALNRRVDIEVDHGSM